MMKKGTPPARTRLVLTAALGFVLGAAHASGNDAETVTDGEKLFALHVKPLFAEKCNACHGDEPEKIKGSRFIADVATRAHLDDDNRSGRLGVRVEVGGGGRAAPRSAGSVVEAQGLGVRHQAQ